MPKIRLGTVSVSRLVYIHPVTGETTEANDSIQALEGKTLWTPSYELSDRILGSYRGTIKGFVSEVPASPADGDRYVVTDSAIGAFIPFEKKVVQYYADEGAWHAESGPQAGTLVYNQETDKFYKFSSDTISTGNWTLAVDASSTGGSGSSGTVIRANAQNMLDQSYLQYNIDFAGNKPSTLATFTSGDSPYVAITKGYVDTAIAGLTPGVSYPCDSTVTKAGQLVTFSSTARQVTQLVTSTSKEALGITATAPSGGLVNVLADNQKILIPVSRVASGSVGQRILLKTDGSGDFTTTMPLTPSHRIWQAGVIARVDLTSGSPTEGYLITVLVKFIRANGPAS